MKNQSPVQMAQCVCVCVCHILAAGLSAVFPFLLVPLQGTFADMSSSRDCIR